ncbi:hypothetical protein METBIDRAFT_136767 [Metschnikowia bicuspidata var. bicuspidata NRRL YB-4993]|uniref:Uncharacterized protein n=1 Tax=Metschnikowia bicuspidata var. bicuspidata NRRL YB-4993 TaxID=869754 RepID=A0A1A0GZ15_9ASCO|nr:hypothetical protein METBIDRAFT_136767 [Metschnikowia bicuspidata var. bicuspidata NRRL YB-4993]OBA16968.1 hypothetical protein METBIDRAFT_136767 [Metschnikowia bicuspidata var. bicuspidata NRRL YB-4993]
MHEKRAICSHGPLCVRRFLQTRPRGGVAPCVDAILVTGSFCTARRKHCWLSEESAARPGCRVFGASAFCSAAANSSGPERNFAPAGFVLPGFGALGAGVPMCRTA